MSDGWQSRSPSRSTHHTHRNRASPSPSPSHSGQRQYISCQHCGHWEWQDDVDKKMLACCPSCSEPWGGDPKESITLAWSASGAGSHQDGSRQEDEPPTKRWKQSVLPAVIASMAKQDHNELAKYLDELKSKYDQEIIQGAMAAHLRFSTSDVEGQSTPTAPVPSSPGTPEVPLEKPPDYEAEERKAWGSLQDARSKSKWAIHNKTKAQAYLAQVEQQLAEAKADLESKRQAADQAERHTQDCQAKHDQARAKLRFSAEVALVKDSDEEAADAAQWQGKTPQQLQEAEEELERQFQARIQEVENTKKAAESIGRRLHVLGAQKHQALLAAKAQRGEEQKKQEAQKEEQQRLQKRKLRRKQGKRIDGELDDDLSDQDDQMGVDSQVPRVGAPTALPRADPAIPAPAGEGACDVDSFRN